MASAKQQVHSADSVICRNIDNNSGDRGLLAQNILAQLRNLVEGVIVWADLNEGSATFDYDQVAPAKRRLKMNRTFEILTRFHNQLQPGVSHYTLDGDPSERLMLKYYEYLLRTRELARAQLGIDILSNIERFPIDADPSARAYHEAIASRTDEVRQTSSLTASPDRYYIHNSRPFFIDGRIYYEVTFSLAHNRTSKSDRILGFTNIDLTSKYAAKLELEHTTVRALGQAMPIVLIRHWEVSIRPCEFDNFARIFDLTTRVQSTQAEYRSLMQHLTSTRSSLLDLMDMDDQTYSQIRTAATGSQQRPLIFPVLDQAREVIMSDQPGSRVLRYVMLSMNNQILKAQFDAEKCAGLSNLRLSWSCKPFDTMPFCTSPRRHNPRFADIAEILDAESRPHELLARKVKNNVERHGSIYTPAIDLQSFGDIDELIVEHNRRLPANSRHAKRKLAHSNGHVFIVGYEEDTATIIEELQAITVGGIAGHTSKVRRWIDANPEEIDDALKKQALTDLFEHSKVALIYGAAGTGKSTMVDHVAKYFGDERKLFLAHTNPAVDNLKRRVQAPNAEFSTISKHLTRRSPLSASYDMLVIDECSTVSNASLLKLLRSTKFETLVLVGDTHQIESIEFGNWFSAIRPYISKDSVFELTEPYRAENEELIQLWNSVRKLDDDIEELFARNNHSTVLGESLFKEHRDDEVVLCLNYDGLYGINNVNRFLQSRNSNAAVTWDEFTYKVGDPVLFNEIDRFRPVIFNNLKGKIAAIDRAPGRITFDVDLRRELTAADVFGTELRWVSDSVVQFDVFERGNTDDDDNAVNVIVPFQIAYALSIHKAQGLEYDSVKVVITDANEESISHSIFYTAITRARKHLEVFWSPETQHQVLSRLAARETSKDENLLRLRRGLVPVANRAKRKLTRELP